MNLSVSAKNSSQANATDDEMAAITAAVQAYLLDQEESVCSSESADNNASALSPWAVAARLEGAGTSTGTGAGAGSDINAQHWSKSKPWGCVFALSLGLAVASLLSAGAPAAMAQSIEEAFPDTQQLAVASQARNTKPAAVAAATDKQIKVCLSVSAQRADLDFPDGGSVYTVADGTLVGKIAPQSAWNLNLARAKTNNSGGGAALVFAAKSVRDRITPANSIAKVAFVPSTGSFFGTNNEANQLVLPLLSSSPSIDASQGYIAIPDQQPEGGQAVPLIGVNGKLYRGAVVLKPCSKVDSSGVSNTTGITLVNVLDLEDYLLSVVPSEVPSLWPKEVLKAQAIAARSYAVANLGKHKNDGYDVKATVDDQVYRGVVAESAETNAAVAETSGLVLKNGNKVISAFFHSTSGGSTEVSENVWGKPLPYLKSVVDYDDAAPQFTWRKTITSQALSKALFATPDSQALLGVLVIGRHAGDSQRVRDVLVIGQSSARVIAGTELRRLFNLPSTQFSLFQSDSSYIFSGRGYGHGLGLSQWGAKALADNGYNAEQILSYYYKDVTIEPLAQEGAI
jgi:stage II sporulation protein D